MQKTPFYLLLGDIFVLLIVTLVGFSTHDRLSSGAVRIGATFIPLVTSWVLIGVHVGVFHPAYIAEPRQLWRPFWAMVLAGPFAGWMRGLFLKSGVAPIFVVVLGGVSALSLLAWRALYLVINNRFLYGRNSTH